MLRHLRNVALLLCVQRSSRHKNCWIGGQMLDSIYSMLLYADDRMLYRPIRTPDDYIQLQMDIDKLCVWTKNNLMQYNVNKCKYIIISRRKQPSLPNTPLAVDNAPMDMVSEYKYLGVLLTSSLDWSKHVTRVCKNARQQVGILYGKFYGH